MVRPAQTARSERTREALRRAALVRFIAQGVEETSAEQIAADAGVSLRTFYRHFASKHDLLFADYDAGLHWFRSALAARSPAESIIESVQSAIMARPYDDWTVTKIASLRAQELDPGRIVRHLRQVEADFAEAIEEHLTRDNPVPITEDVPVRGSPEHYYSEQKAACEAALVEITAGSALEVFVLRPCIVAGPKAPALADAMPWNQLPGPVKTGRPGAAAAETAVPRSRHAAATRSPRRRRIRNRFGRNHFRTPRRLQHRRGRCVVDVRCGRGAGRPSRPGTQKVAMSAASEVIARLPFVPSALEWLHVGRTSVVMDTSKAKTQLGWTPKYTAAETLAALAETSKLTASGRRCRRVRSMWHHLRPTSRRDRRSPWPDRCGRRRPRPRRRRRTRRCSGCLSSRVTTQSSVTATPKLSHPIAGHPATWTGNGLVLGPAFRRWRVPVRRHTRLCRSSRTSPHPVRTTG